MCYRCSQHAIGAQYAKIMMKKVKILPKGLKGTELIFKNAKVTYPKSVVPIIISFVSHLPQCRYESQRCCIAGSSSAASMVTFFFYVQHLF
jgi:hypothetical protein